MAQCQWCGRERDLRENGYCEECYQDVRNGIKNNIDLMDAIFAEAKTASPDQAGAILARADEAYNKLLIYKRRRVPFYKTNPTITYNAIRACLNQQPVPMDPSELEAPSEAQPQRTGMPAYAKPQKSKMAAGMLAIFLGTLGIHNFYLGYTRNGVIQLVLTLTMIGAIPSAIWAIIDAIHIFTGELAVDANGIPLTE